MEEKDASALKFSVEYAKEYYYQHVNNISVYKDTVKNILGFASILVSASALANVIGKPINKPFMLFGAFLYLSIVIVSLWSANPSKIHFPVEMRWDELYNTFFNKSDVDRMEIMLSAYLNAVEKNKQPIRRMALITRIVQILFIGLTICVFGALFM